VKHSFQIAYLKRPEESWNKRLFTKAFSPKALNNEFLAGLLTYSFSGRPSHP
jgi:hypothetical protein